MLVPGAQAARLQQAATAAQHFLLLNLRKTMKASRLRSQVFDLPLVSE